MNQIAASGTC